MVFFPGIMKTVDLHKTSAKKVRSLLEEKLGVDLVEQKKAIDEIVMELAKKGKNANSKGESEEDEEVNLHIGFWRFGYLWFV